MILAAGSIGLGYIGKELLLSGVVEPVVPGIVKAMPLMLSVLGGIMGYAVCD